MLFEGCDRLSLQYDNPVGEQLLDYLALLECWNGKFNLSGVRTMREMVGRHLLDSLAISPFLVGRRVLDVGTGAGLPGIPLAITNPALHITMVDSVHKKIRFVRHVVATLALGNAVAIAGRVQTLGEQSGYDMIVARAFAAVDRYLGSIEHVCGSGTRVLAMGGQLDRAVERAVPANFRILVLEEYQVPFVSGQRYVMVVEKRSL